MSSEHRACATKARDAAVAGPNGPVAVWNLSRERVKLACGDLVALDRIALAVNALMSWTLASA
jgi:hypothetical protein